MQIDSSSYPLQQPSSQNTFKSNEEPQLNGRVFVQINSGDSTDAENVSAIGKEKIPQIKPQIKEGDEQSFKAVDLSSGKSTSSIKQPSEIKTSKAPHLSIQNDKIQNFKKLLIGMRDNSEIPDTFLKGIKFEVQGKKISADQLSNHENAHFLEALKGDKENIVKNCSFEIEDEESGTKYRTCTSQEEADEINNNANANEVAFVLTPEEASILQAMVAKLIDEFIETSIYKADKDPKVKKEQFDAPLSPSLYNGDRQTQMLGKTHHASQLPFSNISTVFLLKEILRAKMLLDAKAEKREALKEEERQEILKKEINRQILKADIIEGEIQKEEENKVVVQGNS